MTIERGVSLYSFQQSQFFKFLDLDQQIAVVGGLEGVTGIEIVDEMSLRYPDPGEAFIRHWFAMMERHGTRPVAMDVGMDVLQFRDHVMSIDECTERLRHDLRLAHRLGFSNVRVLSTTPAIMLEKALPLAEELDIRLGKEIHQPMSLAGSQVAEILDLIERTGSRHVGIVPDLGIFQFRPSEAALNSFLRKGARRAAADAVIALSDRIRAGETGDRFDMSQETAGNIRSDFRRFLTSGACPDALRDAFEGIVEETRAAVEDPAEIDYVVVGEALTFSNTTEAMIAELAPHVTHVHGKFYEMSEQPDQPGVYDDVSIDTAAAIRGLKAGGFSGFVNSEYEGQRFYQDRGIADLMDEAEQVRRHQSMLARLLG